MFNVICLYKVHSFSEVNFIEELEIKLQPFKLNKVTVGAVHIE